MAQDALPDARQRQTPSATGAARAYMSGFGNSFETEALRGGAAGRAQLAAARSLWSLRRTAVGLAVHCAARQQ